MYQHQAIYYFVARLHIRVITVVEIWLGSLHKLKSYERVFIGYHGGLGAGPLERFQSTVNLLQNVMDMF